MDRDRGDGTDPSGTGQHLPVIGMIRSKGAPGGVALAATHAAALLGGRLIYFTPDDVDLAPARINAWAYGKERWTRVRAGYPDVIANDTSSMRSRRVWEALTRHAPFTTPYLGSKSEILRRMLAEDFFPDLQIPTVDLGNLDDLRAALAAHGRIVVKPSDGSKGRNVFFLGCDGEAYLLNDGAERRLDAAALEDFFRDRLAGKGFIAQRYVESRTRQGLPFDVRLHVSRNGRGRWQTVQIYARIGGGRTITSNVSAGGSVSRISAFLRGQYGDEKGDEIRRNLRRLAGAMPDPFQALFPNHSLESLGIDIGLDRDGAPWLFEVNPAPGSWSFTLEAAIPTVAYALRLARLGKRAATSPAAIRETASTG